MKIPDMPINDIFNMPEFSRMETVAKRAFWFLAVSYWFAGCPDYKGLEVNYQKLLGWRLTDWRLHSAFFVPAIRRAETLLRKEWLRKEVIRQNYANALIAQNELRNAAKRKAKKDKLEAKQNLSDVSTNTTPVPIKPEARSFHEGYNLISKKQLNQQLKGIDRSKMLKDTL